MPSQGKEDYAGKRFLESWLVLEFCDRCGKLHVPAQAKVCSLQRMVVSPRNIRCGQSSCCHGANGSNRFTLPHLMMQHNVLDWATSTGLKGSRLLSAGARYKTLLIRGPSSCPGRPVKGLPSLT